MHQLGNRPVVRFFAAGCSSRLSVPATIVTQPFEGAITRVFPRRTSSVSLHNHCRLDQLGSSEPGSQVTADKHPTDRICTWLQLSCHRAFTGGEDSSSRSDLPKAERHDGKMGSPGRLATGEDYRTRASTSEPFDEAKLRARFEAPGGFGVMSTRAAVY